MQAGGRALVRKTFNAAKLSADHRKRLGNISHLLTGNVASSVLGLVCYALTARALGVDDFGQLALILAFVRAVERFVSFQSWQPIIKYGAGLWDDKNSDDLRSLLKFGFLLDVSAALMAWLVAAAIGFGAAYVLHWSSDSRDLLVLYSCVLLFGLSGVPTAVQRLSGNFHLLAYGQLINLAVRTGLCALGVWYAAGLQYFLLVWACTQILGAVVLVALALRTLQRQGIHKIFRAELRGIGDRFPRIWDFTWIANLSLTLRSSTNILDTLLVGALADPASAGLYHLAKQLGRAGQEMGAQVQSVIYPDVARLWAKGQVSEFKRVIWQVETTLFTLGVLGVVIVYATVDPLLRWTAGPEFLAAANLVIIQMVAVALVLTGAATRSALLAMGRQRNVLAVVAIATAAFHLTALFLIPLLGAMGGNIAHIVLGLIWLAGLSFSLRRAFQTTPAPAVQIPPEAPVPSFTKAGLPDLKGA
jgi:O-antigen/teichoic acid export membrane protein